MAEKDSVKILNCITPEEARQKWCPFVRAAGDHSGHAATGVVTANRNSDGDTPLSSNCIASDCMSWRWATYAEDIGYCGASGQPH